MRYLNAHKLDLFAGEKIVHLGKASESADNKETKKTEGEEINDCYYLVTAYLFTGAQVERSKKPA